MRKSGILEEVVHEKFWNTGRGCYKHRGGQDSAQEVLIYYHFPFESKCDISGEYLQHSVLSSYASTVSNNQL